jgi:hypothetical protein
MLSWRGTRDVCGRDGLILLLPGDVGVVRGASPETLRDEEQMQVGQRGERHAWRAERHAGTGDRVQHPGRHHRDHAGGGGLDMDDLAGGPPLTVLTTNALPMKRMPRVVDHDLLPDMGRMTP